MFTLDAALRLWSPPDLALLQRLNAPEMKRHLGGPETGPQVLSRHDRYLRCTTDAERMYAIVLAARPEPVGDIGFWERSWNDQLVYETGWAVLPAAQGRGVAKRAVALVIEAAREAGRHRYLHAFPGVGNAASNALCRGSGFTLLGECDFEYPPGSQMRCNDWVFDLAAN